MNQRHARWWRISDQLNGRTTRKKTAKVTAEKMQAVVLEPVRMAPRVDVPVDHAQLGVVLRGRRDRVVHRQVRMMGSPQREPPDTLHPGRLQRGESVLDVARVLIL